MPETKNTRFAREVEFKAEGDGSTLTAYGSAFLELDGHDDVVLPGAYAKTLPDFLASGQLLFEHRDAIGKPLSAVEDAKGLLCKFRISDTALGRDAKTLVTDGVLKKMSIGYGVKQAEYVDAATVRGIWAGSGYRPSDRETSRLATLEVAGRKARLLKELELFEISLVGFPACRGADVLGLKGERVTIDEFVKRLEVAREAVKAGRVLSGANRGRLKEVRGSLSSACDVLDAFLSETENENAEAEQGKSDRSDQGEDHIQESGVARSNRDRLRAKLNLYAAV